MKATMMRRLAMGMTLVLAGPVSAGGFYAGAGFNSNELTPEGTDFDSASGYQLFAGYNFGNVFGTDMLGLRLEGGYFSSGEFEASTSLGPVTKGPFEGVWASGVLDLNLTDSFSLFGRAGYDGGDDDGSLVGVGAAFDLGERFRLSGEVVGRQNVDSFQLNLSVGF